MRIVGGLDQFLNGAVEHGERRVQFVSDGRGVLGKVAAEIAASEGNIVHVSMDEEAEQTAALRQVDANLKVKLKELDIDMEKVHASDRDSARKMAASTGDIWTPRVIAIVVFLVWGVVQYHVFTSTIPEGMRELVARMLGTLDAVLMAVVYYYYGSSSGSAARLAA